MAGLAALLIICMFELPYEYYEIIRFILMAGFAWLAISLKGEEKLGWRFFFGSLALLFNPFFKLKIGADICKVIDGFVSSIILLTVIKDNLNFRWVWTFIKKGGWYLNKWKKEKFAWILFFVTTTLIVLYIFFKKE